MSQGEEHVHLTNVSQTKPKDVLHVALLHHRHPHARVSIRSAGAEG